MGNVIIAEASPISIHALREEGDRFAYPVPVGSVPISIHALREEGDDTHQIDVACVMHFYPRPPRGGRLFSILVSSRRLYFYPRPPRGGRRRR